MKAQLKKILIQFVGWVFILLGIVGLFLPILQGFLFLFIGLIILSSQYPWAHRVLERIRQRFPRISRTADQASERASLWLKRLAGQSASD